MNDKQRVTLIGTWHLAVAIGGAWGASHILLSHMENWIDAALASVLLALSAALIVGWAAFVKATYDGTNDK